MSKNFILFYCLNILSSWTINRVLDILGSSDCEVECCRGCEESFVGTISKTHVNYTQLRSRASSYYVSCGFWGWGSCKKYRLRYYIYKTYKTLYYKTVGMKCDPGCQCVQRVSVGPLPILFLSSNATTSNVTTATSTTPLTTYLQP
ncbi:uncharacterized protein LOC124288480 [Haliotis rubra]|uniref:uncharacterized protein LOC124288480 n=1 Tax=Haliotis rubra TaxID=36100 RepID=UPI001EE55A0D|nr:uncharacterized protein LOC124288480 [Haliotis rubra]